MSNRNRRSRRSSGRHPFHDTYEIKIRPERNLISQVLLLVWRWRIELLLVSLCWFVYQQVTSVVSTVTAVSLMLTPLLLVLVLPWTRRQLSRRAWCVITRHCIRACLVQLRTTNHDGRLPWVVWIRPTPVGERAWLLMLPGLSVTDLEDRTEALAASCWARETRIQRIRSQAALVRLDVIRRDPLTKSTPIDNPLMHSTGRIQTSDPLPTPTVSPALPETLTAPPVADAQSAQPVATATATKPREKTKTSDTGTATAAAPVLVNGEDVSDYV